jgi:hypothetical protein
MDAKVLLPCFHGRMVNIEIAAAYTFEVKPCFEALVVVLTRPGGCAW